ncbi:MAG: UDP-N-acetylglucosamine 1-carboxyvinyltransferase [Lachnospiraceae bacterium]|nr:UDP-N-acetylglucosamine 1-carboxyvinyltransferase [Lachnospiraceae bacterium]
MEQQYIIKGGRPLAGEVTIGGAKNAALGILAAAIMSDETVTIDNLPDVRDINVLLNAIEDIGAIVDRVDRHTVRINGSTISSLVINSEFINKIRASYYLLGALLGKYKDAQVALPGGCDIGSRPIDQHIKGFEALGAKIVIEHGMIKASAQSLVGRHIYLDVVSVGATINIMLAAVLAEGKTIIENPAKEPHIVDVANFLNSMGANIKGAGTDVIRIVGVEKLSASEYSVIPDQIEAGTFMIAAAATKGDVLIKNVIPKHLEAISAKLIEIGAEVYEFDEAVRVSANRRLGHTQIKTQPYPGFPTDMQPQMATILAMGQGTSIVTENIFENRYKYVDELARMGASIKVEGNVAIIDGVSRFTGAAVSAPDLRAGAALVTAALVAEGFSTVDQIYYIERGYENFEGKLKALGADIEKVAVDDEKSMQKFKLRVG